MVCAESEVMPRTFACTHPNYPRNRVVDKCDNCGKRIEWREIIKLGSRRTGRGEWNHIRTLSIECEPTVATPQGTTCYHGKKSKQ